ncbi:hypothetical protein B0H11DRAFT_1935318 [Mycena galericulata]|nr:hypothetical protein B0H11DRAFT_1935318 [Mycena galericulata]
MVVFEMHNAGLVEKWAGRGSLSGKESHLASPNQGRLSCTLQHILALAVRSTLSAFKAPAQTHLIRHIRRLHIRPRRSFNATFSDICALPFTNLRDPSLLIFDRSVLKTCPMPIQQLFSLPTLRRVALECSFDDASDFLPIWTRCCPNLRNVVLDCYQEPESALEPTLSNATTPVHLESLCIKAMNGIIPHWLQHGAWSIEEEGCNKLDALLSPLLKNPFSTVQVQLRSYQPNLELPRYFPQLNARDIITVHRLYRSATVITTRIGFKDTPTCYDFAELLFLRLEVVLNNY